MRTIVHLSDLHFGRIDRRILPPLLRQITAVRPDLVAISGDLTQRARRGQFRQARRFLDAIDFPTLVVPGNHDVPLFNLAARMLDPFGGYRRYISDDLEPAHSDDEVAVIGMNSARGLIAGGRGRLNERQVDAAVARLQSLPSSLVKVIVTHHPFDLPEGYAADHIIGRARMAMTKLAAAGADVMLAGHLHISHVGHTAERYKIAGHSALVIQAGTLSTRSRGERNTFNVVRIARPDMTVERYTWAEGDNRFTPSFAGKFRHTSHGWTA